MNAEKDTTQALALSNLPSGDYVSPNLRITIPDTAFPHMVKGDVSVSTWPYLRREVRHNWYVDARNPTVGFASRDEAAILYNSALLFRGRPCLEIGCWRGWSTVHLALGSGTLDVIDPAIADPDFADDIRASCRKAGVLDSISFHAGFSPDFVDELARGTAKQWSLVFIDGDHEGDAPRRDAEAVARHVAPTAMVLFHDLSSPHVAAGLDYLREQGWQTRLYQTMQIMGVAWRGDVSPAAHVPDPAVAWILPDHLVGYEVSNWQPHGGRLFPATGANQIVTPSSSVPGDTNPTSFYPRRLAELDVRVAALQGERDAALARSTAAEREFAALASRLAAFAETTERAAALQIERDAALDRAQMAEGNFQQLSERLPTLLATIARANAAEQKNGELQKELETAKHGPADELGSWDFERRLATYAGIRDLATWFTRRRVLLGMLRRPGAERIAIVCREAEMLGIGGPMAGEFALWLCPRRVLLGLLRRSSRSSTAIARIGMLDMGDAMLRGPIDDAQISPLRSRARERALEFEKRSLAHQRLQHRFQALAEAKRADESVLLDARIELATRRVVERQEEPASPDLGRG